MQVRDPVQQSYRQVLHCWKSDSTQFGPSFCAQQQSETFYSRHLSMLEDAM
jgi:hypothetical protein